TTPASYIWYQSGTSACIMCHVDIPSDTTHNSHVGTAYGRDIGCSDCHEAATNWSTNTKPASGHLNGTFTVSGGVAFTYSGATYPTVKGTCSTNVCHNIGYSALTAPARSYTWGVALADNCASCHGYPNSSGNEGARHTAHVNNTAFVAGGCSECHPASTDTTHLNGVQNTGGASTVVYTAPGCTNVCHTVDTARGERRGARGERR
ncbi:MAG: CxxxxCH/CxxCH domain-containing protein, partial [bacterium]|nr:CxxxxCH/CxxCH domain-containing protein [bacterium]